MVVKDLDPATATSELSQEARRAVVALLVFGHPPVSAPQLAPFPNLKCVSNFGVGYDHVDVPACTAAGVPVGNTPGAVAEATADLGFALLLASARNVVKGDERASVSSLRLFDAHRSSHTHTPPLHPSGAKRPGLHRH